MPTFTMKEQDGNSCAAHCTVVAIAEITGTKSLDETFAEKTLWPAIQFQPENGDPAIALLAAAKNSDPRRIVSEAKRRWPTVNAALVCDEVQKKIAIPFVKKDYQIPMEGMFNMLTSAGVKTKLLLDEGAYYNCSFTMHDGSDPTAANYSGMHNILVTYMGGKTFYYNSNETKPAWKEVKDWKVLKNQNGGQCSYVFTGVGVVFS